MTLVNTSGNVIQGNLIGTGPNGTTPLGNGGIGLDVVTSSNNTVGGAGNARNTVSNNGTGMQIRTGANDNVVTNNAFAANGLAIRIDDASRNRIGGINAADGNVIQNNQTGIVVLTATAISNSILGNSITGSAFLGIDIDSNGITPNDANDVDSGPNGRQNFPVLAAASGGVQGTLNSIPDATFRIEFFGNTACDASGNGEGAMFLGATAVTTDGTGNATIPLFSAAAGQVVTATATDSSNNTSEFSNCVQVQAASAELAVTATDSPDPVIVGTQLGYSVTLTNNGPSPATNARITFVWNAAVTIDAATPSQGACEMTPLLVCSFGTVADDASVTVGIAVRPNVIGPLTATMTAQAAESDPVPGNNAAAVNTSVIGGPSSFLVTNVNDSGAGSLRQAILNANASSGTDAISFGIPSAEGQTITLASPLPAITDPVSISGATQPGFAGTPIVELNGNGITGSGLTVSAANTTLSGLVINRFNGPGIQIIGNNTTNTFVQGNYIGTDLTGTLARPNAVGIQIGNTVTSPTNSLIGGTTAATRNVISGNTGSGVVLPTGNGHAVTGNYIGTSADGAGDLGNGGAGVWIVSATNTAVGATAPGAGNVISGNNQHGVLISGSPATLHGNLIGTNAAGDAGVPNGLDGIRIEFASGNTIGGVPGFGNTIAFNTGSGVTIQTGSSNRISGNSIHSNGALGIDLLPAGVTPNDAGDADTGPNNLLNFPVLTAVTGGVQGTLNSTPNGTFRIEFFRNLTCDASGNGEGATFLGTTTVTTDVTGNGTIPLFTAAGGQLVVATATDSSNNTSEFSSCVQTGGQPALTSVVPASAAQGVTLDVALTGVNTTFASGTTTVGFGAGIAVNSVTVTSPTSATANITVSPTAFTGGRTVTVTTGTEVVTSAFAVTAGPALLSSISPTSGQQGQTNLNLTVTGQNTHFVQDVTTATLGGGVIVNSVTVNSPTSATDQHLNRALRPGCASGHADDRR